jgi:hypothetical protein
MLFVVHKIFFNFFEEYFYLYVYMILMKKQFFN